MNEELKKRIKNLIDSNDIIVFMKGTPAAPQCGFTARVVHVFEVLKVNFGYFNVLKDEEVRQGIKDYSDWPTIPQVYIKGEFIGGCDITLQMFESGALQEKLGLKKE